MVSWCRREHLEWIIELVEGGDLQAPPNDILDSVAAEDEVIDTHYQLWESRSASWRSPIAAMPSPRG